jgi:hypothetical protein
MIPAPPSIVDIHRDDLNRNRRQPPKNSKKKREFKKVRFDLEKNTFH